MPPQRFANSADKASTRGLCAKGSLWQALERLADEDGLGLSAEFQKLVVEETARRKRRKLRQD